MRYSLQIWFFDFFSILKRLKRNAFWACVELVVVVFPDILVTDFYRFRILVNVRNRCAKVKFKILKAYSYSTNDT
ncbi:hypothetical protein CN558_29175 [Bacillus wiedmannii]|uniref:Uncharacterized protein n=1 Tax=Bacillus wiedmannii TaxID=1890302 RepID=A0A2A8CFT6_9BACI|nr:hypothetical protein [Bacillus wiedmannii]PEL82477.1 hypothetical protein CN609_10185 [Bacillus wiedmannii]PEM84473.1 hypothetical protein CN627_22560 [Bacillus wiedmannii]PEO78781.1 hypothetical protein CN558_29175 [Bacillus wiedmannii]PFZ36024.1 hypothetical protein COL77_28945 [Bacillus wiedmannii]PGA83829.1 hypothetical protein COL94_19285 [Bacillus wiedmannii]